MIRRRIFFLDFVLGVLPILAFIHGLLYDKLNLEGTKWDTSITGILIISLPFSAFYFLSSKNKFFKIYGGIVCIYIIYLLYTFLEQTSGAL